MLVEHIRHSSRYCGKRIGIPTYGNGFLYAKDSLFQSTRPHGARPSALLHLFTFWLFQSTRPHGARHKQNVLRGYNREFQSTRPHGARQGGLSCEEIAYMFQSTRPHGARQTARAGRTRPKGFNPRAHTGRDSIFSKRLNICIQNYTFCETWQTYTQNCFY